MTQTCSKTEAAAAKITLNPKRMTCVKKQSCPVRERKQMHMEEEGCCWCQLVPRTLRSPFSETFPHRDGRAHTQSLVCISQSPHSIGVGLHLPVPAAFGASPCSHLFIQTPALLSAAAQAQRRPPPLLALSTQPPEPSLVCDSPVLRCSGCWATVSLLELCPMLRRLFPLACLGLPLLRPRAAAHTLKPPQSASTKHGVCAASTVPAARSGLASPLPPACVTGSLPPRVFGFKTQTRTLAKVLGPSLP